MRNPSSAHKKLHRGLALTLAALAPALVGLSACGTDQEDVTDR